MESLSRKRRKRSPEYDAWADMRRRCLFPENKRWADYGGRGITICERWAEFKNFLEDMGKRPEGRYTLERKNNDLGYSPDNCKWATYGEQNRNNRRSRFITYKGRTQCVMDWATELGVDRRKLKYRLDAGWTPEQVIETPFSRANRFKRPQNMSPEPAS